MEIVIAAVVLAAGLVAGASLLSRRAPALASSRTDGKGAPAATPAEPSKSGAGPETDLKERRTEMVRLEERLLSKEAALDQQRAALTLQEEAVQQKQAELAELRDRHVRELERVAGLSASQAKQILLRELEDQIRHDCARRVRQIEDETKRDADRRVRNILSVVMQRMAAGHAAETTVSVVQLSADDM
jgi:ribonuclease Y